MIPPRVRALLPLLAFLSSAAAVIADTPEPTQDHYTFKNVAIGGGGFVTGIIFNPTEKGLVYARTDVGGAYRMDSRSGGAWVPLLDWAGQTDWNLEQGKITAASVLLNFDQYNGPGLATFDLESETLHQLGHVLGLLHSCNGSSGGSADATTAPACLQGGVLAVPKAYADAVMFPFLLDGQVKHTLGQNDTGRVSCLY